MAECKPRIVFIPTSLRNPTTGGEIYNRRLLTFLRETFKNVESIKIGTFQTSAKKYHEMAFFSLTSLVRNFLFLFKIVNKKYNQRVFLFEDLYYSMDLFLLNFIIKRIKKNVSIIPLVHHLHYPLGRKNHIVTLVRIIEGTFLNESDLIIVNSEATKRDVQRLLRRPKEILIAYPGLNKKNMSKHISRYPRSEGLNLLAVGALTERKDFETLLKATKLLTDQYNKTKLSLNIIGDLDKDKEYSQKIIRMAKDLTIFTYIKFRGKVDEEELYTNYANSDIFVSTSLHEGFGMAIAEAMYNHLPVVATNCGAVPYLVEDGVNGFLVPPRDYEQLAEKIKLLLESEGLRKKMGAKGFCKAKKFDWDRTFNKIYEKLVEVT